MSTLLYQQNFTRTLSFKQILHVHEYLQLFQNISFLTRGKHAMDTFMCILKTSFHNLFIVHLLSSNTYTNLEGSPEVDIVRRKTWNFGYMG